MVRDGLGAGEVIHVVTIGEGDTHRISKVFTVPAMAADVSWSDRQEGEEIF